MNIWNKVFLGIIFVASIVIVVFGAIELKIRNTGQKHIAQKEKEIADKESAITKIIEGTTPAKLLVDKEVPEWGYEELRNKVLELYSERGRAWQGCIVASIAENTRLPALRRVEAQVIITGPPDGRGIETDAASPGVLRGVVYIFREEYEDNACTFLGRFNVEGEPTTTMFRDQEGNQRNGFRVTLITVDPISEEEIETIFEASQSRWALYMTLPINHRVAGVFDRLEEEHGGIDPNVLAVWERHRDKMDDSEAQYARDYSSLLYWLYRQRSGTYRAINITKDDIETYRVAEEKTKAENEKLTADCILEEKRRDAMEVQRNAVKNLLEEYEKETAQYILQIEKFKAMSAAYVAAITEAQLRVVEKIEHRVAEIEKNKE